MTGRRGRAAGSGRPSATVPARLRLSVPPLTGGTGVRAQPADRDNPASNAGPAVAGSRAAGASGRGTPPAILRRGQPAPCGDRLAPTGEPTLTRPPAAGTTATHSHPAPLAP